MIDEIVPHSIVLICTKILKRSMLQQVCYSEISLLHVALL